MKTNAIRQFCSIPSLAILILVVAFTGEAQSNKQGAPEITFSVSMPKPHTHMLDVEVRIKRGAGEQVANQEMLIMPVWTPGSYLIREFARHVQDFAATDAAGQPLKWEKINKDAWRVVTNGS